MQYYAVWAFGVTFGLTTMERTFTDQLKRMVKCSFPPRKIISLVPSQTELLYTLGLEEEVVGITKFCIHPEVWHKQKTIVGGTKQFHHERIHQLQPDLIIANKEENTKEDIEKLSHQYPTWLSDIYTLNDALQMIKSIGSIVDREKVALRLVENITSAFTQLPNFKPLRVAYLIWRKPYMAVASNTFINEMLLHAGFVNVFQDLERYPEIRLKTLAAQAPDVLLLSSEPYPFNSSHFEEFQDACPNTIIKIVDGELFSWYGSRLLKTPEYLLQLRKLLS